MLHEFTFVEVETKMRSIKVQEVSSGFDWLYLANDSPFHKESYPPSFFGKLS